MAAARERRISLYAYNTRADAEANTNGTEYTSGIVDDTPRYEHVFFTELPGWGEANAAMFSCDISGTADLSDKWVRVKYSYYATDAATTMTDKWLFLGRVDSCKYDTLKTVRTLVAYDLLYWLRSVDISKYWANYWSNEDRNRSIAAFLSNMSADIGVTLGNIGATMLPTSTIAAAGAKATTLSGCSFVDMLAFIGQLCRVYFFIGGDGKLNCARTSNSETAAPVDALIDTQNTEIGDGALPAYTAMMAYSGADVIYSTGSGEPLYTIRDNPLLNGKTTAEITTQLNALFSELDNVTGFWPGEFEYIVSSPEEFGNVATGAVTYTPNLSTQDGNETRLHAAAAVECWGVQLINQRVTCPTAMTTGGAVSASMSAALNAIQQMGVEMTYKVNADNVIEAVNMEASDTVKINASAVNINGAISANGNTKINTDGTLEAVNGKFSGQLTSQTGLIGGFNLANNKIYKRSGATPVEANYYNGVEIVSDYEPYIAVGGRTGRLTPQGEVEVVQIAQNRFGLFVERGYDDGGDAGGDFYPECSTTLDGKYISINDGNNETYIDPTSLYIADKDILRTHQSLVGGWGTAIPANANLNTDEYCEVGRFYVGSDSTAATHTNCPTRYAYMMDVFAPISSDYENTSYIVREIRTRYGDRYVQYVTGSTTKSYSKWAMQLSSASDNTVFADQITSRNIVNNAGIRNGSFDGQGQETTNNTRIRTGYVGALPNTQYGIRTNYSTLQIYEVHEYTSSRTFIKYTSVNSSSIILKTSSTTGFIRILMRYSDNRILTTDEGAKLQVERGEQLSAYSPNQSYSDRIIVPFYSYSDLGTATTDSAFFQAWLKRIAVNYDYFAGKIIEGRVQPNGTGAVFGHMYNGVNANGMPNYSGFTYVSVGVLKYFGTNNGTFYLRSVNYTSEV